MDDDLRKAVGVLAGGGIAVFPTDTAFAIGCRIDDRAAVDRLFAVRRRPPTQATPVLVDSPAMALAYFDRPAEIVGKLMSRYWPGALTIVSACDAGKIPPLVRGGGATVGMRMPDHPAALALITGVGVPILGTSANFHGEKTPFAYGELDPELLRLVDAVVPGVCRAGNVSTVVDVSGARPAVLRQGAVTVEWGAL
jgi:L-threonylcarbamoyladenylate synthase